MTDKMQQAKEYLAQIRKTDRLIQRLDETVCNLRRSLTSRSHTLQPDKVQTSGAGDRIGDTVAKIDELEREINRHIDDIIEMKQQAFRIIKKIPDLDQQNVLIGRYIQNKEWEALVHDFNFSPQWLFEIHGRGIVAFAEQSKIELNLLKTE